MSAHEPAGVQGQPQLRINLRPLADPLPLGLYSFGIGMMLLGAQEAGWIPLREASQVGILVAAFVFPLEGLAAIFAFLERDTLASTVLGLFATSWATIGLILITGTPGATSIALGFYLMAFAAAVLALAFVATLGKPLIAAILMMSATRAILDGLYEFSGGHGVEHAAGYVGAVIAGTALYAGTAFVLEDVRQASVLPVLRRGKAGEAMDGRLADQVRPVGSEAGVRQQL